jgi:hypothetical protein
VSNLPLPVTVALYIPPTYSGSATLIVEDSSSTTRPVTIVSWMEVISPRPGLVVVNDQPFVISFQAAGFNGTFTNPAIFSGPSASFTLPQLNGNSNSTIPVTYDATLEAFSGLITQSLPAAYAGPLQLTIYFKGFAPTSILFYAVAPTATYPPLPAINLGR